MINVLIADDSLFMREIIKGILGKQTDINVIGEADNGAVCFEKYKELKPDVVTLDIVMGDANGISALQNIIGYNKDAVVIMVTSVGQEKYVRQCLEIGARGFIIKPFAEEEVVNAIRKAVAARI